MINNIIEAPIALVVDAFIGMFGYYTKAYGGTPYKPSNSSGGSSYSGPSKPSNNYNDEGLRRNMANAERIRNIKI